MKSLPKRCRRRCSGGASCRTASCGVGVDPRAGRPDRLGRFGVRLVPGRGEPGCGEPGAGDRDRRHRRGAGPSAAAARGGRDVPITVTDVPITVTVIDPVRRAAPARSLVVLLLVVLLLMVALSGVAAVLAPDAAAHATVASSDPSDGARLAQAPSRVTVTFDEAVGLDLGYLRVVNGDGTDVGASPAEHPGGQGQVIALELKSGLGEGSYIASWRVISADSHPVEGSIRFVVGNGALAAASSTGPVVASSTSIAFDVMRTAGYLSLALLGGGWLLLSIWPAGRSDAAARRVLTAGWCVAVAAAAGETLLQGAYAAGSGLAGVLDFGLLSDTIDTKYGLLHVIRLLLLAGLGVLLDSMLSAGGTRPTIRPTIRRGLPGVLLFLAVVFTVSDSGHAAVAQPGWLALSSDMAHLTAMSAWVGGLVLLVVAVLPRRHPAELRTVLPTFSRVAFICVLVIAVTGTYQAWRESGTVAAITTTTYGRLVLLKAALFIGLLLLGNLSRLAIQRRYIRQTLPAAVGAPAGRGADPPDRDRQESAEGSGVRTVDPVDPVDPDDRPVRPTAAAEDSVDTRRMRRSVLAELVLAAVVLSVSGVLVAQPPGRTAVAAPPALSVTASTALDATRSVWLTVNPARSGTVGVDLALHGGAVPLQVTATAALASQQLGPLPVPLHQTGALTYHADGVLLPEPGQWTFTIIVRASEFDAVTTSVQIAIS